MIGTSATGGQLVAPPMSYGTGGTPNEYLVYVIALGCIRGQALSRVILQDDHITLGPETADWGRPATGDLAGHVRATHFDGTQTAAYQPLIDAFGSDPDRPWQADMIGRGVPYAVVRFKYNRELMNSLPAVRFEVKGIPLYDPRKDSTVGGSGPQRWADPSTWAWSDNNAVAIYTIMRGITLESGDVWGGDCTADDLPLDEWIAAMNECDRAIALKSGGTERQYRCGFEVSLDMEPADVIDDLLAGCSGQMVDCGGRWSIQAGSPRLPLYYVADSDIVISDAEGYTPYPEADEIHNAVTATYPEPDSLWETREAPALTNADYEAADGDQRLVADLQLPATPCVTQVRRLMAAYLADSRRMRQLSMALPPDAAILTPLDTIGVTSGRHGFGLTGGPKLFEVTRVEDAPLTMIQRLGIRERDPSDYDWTPDRELPTSPGGGGSRLPIAQTGFSFTVTGGILRDGDGEARRPMLQLGWDASAVRDAEAILWEARLAGTGTVVARGAALDVAAGGLIVADGILPATGYEVHGKVKIRRPTDWTAWLPATTPAVKLGMDDLADEIEQNFREIAQRAGIPTVEGLPASGDSPDQIVFDLETHTLHRWDADAGEWVDNIYAGIPDGSLDLTKFAQGIEPVTIIAAGQPLPTVKSTSTVFWEGRLYQWSGTAYVAPELSVADGSISAAKLADAAVVAAKLAAGAVTHASIKAGAIYGDVIAANAITARELFLTDFANMLPNPEMVDGSNAASLAGWGQLSASAPATVQAGLSWQTLSRATLILGPSALSVGIVPQGQGFGVAAGDEFWFSAVALREASAVGGNIALAVREYDAALNCLGLVEVVYNGALTNSFQTLSGSYVAGASGNANVRYIFPIIYRKGSASNAGNVFATRPQFRRKNAANLIVDGAITTTKLAADSVTAGKLAADAVTAGTIAAGAVTAREVQADAILAKHIALIDFTNILTNGDFADGLTGWTRTCTGISVLNHGQATWPKPQCLFIPTNQAVNIAIYSGDATQPNGTKVFKVSAGDSYRLDFSYARSAPQAILYAQVGYSDSTRTRFGWSTIVSIPAAGANGLLEIGETFTVPAEVPGNAGIPPAYCIIRLLAAGGGASGGYDIVDMRMRKAADASLVVDGAITANKIAAGAVTTNTLAAGAVITSKLAAGAVTAAKIAVAQLSAISADLGDITVDSAHIADLAVGRAKIADASVTTGFGVEGNASHVVADNGINSYQTILSLAVPLDGAARVIVGTWYRGQLTNTGSINDGYGNLVGRVTRNGTVLAGSDLQVIGLAGTPTVRDVASFVRSFSLPAGTHAFRVEAAASESSRSPTIQYPSLFAFVACK